MNTTKKKREGEIHYSKDGERVTIIRYKDYQNTTVQFEDGYIIEDIHYHLVKTSKFSRKSLVKGVGIFEKGKYKGTENKKMTVVYSTWKSMLSRCYDVKTKIKHPTYEGVTVCQEWLYFQVFAEWFYNNYVEGWHLDKDILCPDCKIYSPETCAFVPPEVNALFSFNTIKKSGLPRGITYDDGWYRATISCNKKRFHLGLYRSIEEAESVYNEHRRKCMYETAERLKSILPKKVYEKLSKY